METNNIDQPRSTSTNIDKSTTIINNISVKKNPYTTIFGIVIILVSIGVIIAPIFITEKTSLPTWSGWALLGIGILLLFAPDKLIGGLGKLADKKSDSL